MAASLVAISSTGFSLVVVVTNSLLVQQQWYVLNREGVEDTDKFEGGTRGKGCSTPRGGGEG
jgi:hypothetical protein